MSSPSLTPRSFEKSLNVTERPRSPYPPLSPRGLPRPTKSSDGASMRSPRIGSSSPTPVQSPMFSAEFQPSPHGDLQPRPGKERRASLPASSPTLPTAGVSSPEEHPRSPFLVRVGRGLKAEICSCFGKPSGREQADSSRKPRRWDEPEEYIKVEAVHWTEL